MKKVFTVLMAGALSVFAATNVMAFPKEGKSYFNFNLGYAINNPKVNFGGPTTTSLKPMDRGFAFDGGFGYHLLDEVRIGVNPFYARDLAGKKTSGSGVALLTNKNIMNQYGIFLNGYYDILMGGKVNPFISLGLGYTRIEMENRTTFNAVGGRSKNSLNKIAYRGGLGFAYHLSSAIDMELGYSLIKRMGKKKNRTMQDVIPSLGLTMSSVPSATQLMTIGMRFTF